VCFFCLLCFSNKCPFILASCVYCELICVLCFTADSDQNALGKGLQVTVAVWSPFANSDLISGDLTYKKIQGRHLQGRHGDQMMQMATFIRPDVVAMRSPWRPTNANGDHMQMQKFLHGRHLVAMATERHKWRHRAFKL
jgi:hypothetical protein